jgi:hypothetical protein
MARSKRHGANTKHCEPPSAAGWGAVLRRRQTKDIDHRPLVADHGMQQTMNLPAVLSLVIIAVLAAMTLVWTS